MGNFVNFNNLSAVLTLILLYNHGSFGSSDSSPKLLPTVYEYYTQNGIGSGLTYEGREFLLNGLPLRIYSAGMHYFRVHPNQWRDRLQRIRASGCNTVETYVPWNLHEPKRGEFDFGQKSNDMSILLDIRRFIQIAQEEDLLVMLRPGPYICGEFEFGGLPSWLQTDNNMKVRTMYGGYLERVKIYFDNLLPQVADLQFSKGGSIIMVQLENELGAFDNIQLEYLQYVQQCMEENGLEGPFFTSDHVSSNADKGALPGVLHGANQGPGDVETGLNLLLQLRPNWPVIVPEFWTGSFTHWFSSRHSTGATAKELADGLEIILDKFNGSVNFFMFIGGTSFGFTAGANGQWNGTHWTNDGYGADVTNYDYGAPLAEWGDYRDKYYAIKETIDKFKIVDLHTPEPPPDNIKTAYPSVELQQYLSYNDFVTQAPAFEFEKPVSMEHIPINDGNGQSYGYVVYRKQGSVYNGFSIQTSRVHDFGMLIIDGKVQPSPYFVSPASANWTVSETSPSNNSNIDILVENMGRVNFGHAVSFQQQKGLPNGTVYYNGLQQSNFTTIPLEFKRAWLQNLTGWEVLDETNENIEGPCIIKSSFQLNSRPNDTFIDMSGWHKGIVFVNGFNIGRYFKAGPQQNLYAPAPLFNLGTNTITIFEMYETGPEIVFSSTAELGPTEERMERLV